MALSLELFAAILSLDSYCRGYNPRISGLPDAPGTRIGDATLIRTDADRDVSFFASTYSWEGHKVISFRGTDNTELFAASDIWTGWLTGGGFASIQALKAEEVYADVTGRDPFDGIGQDVILTGHSLGGGLAGYVAAISHNPAFIFNHMPYAAAASARWFDENSERTIFNTLYIPAKIAEAASVPFPFNIFFWETIPAPKPPVLPITAFAVTDLQVQDEVLQDVRAFAPEILTPLLGPLKAPVALADTLRLRIEENNLPSLDPHTGSLIVGIPESVSRHSLGLLILLKYAQEKGLETWQRVGKELFNAYFDDDIGKALGLEQGRTGSDSPSGQLLSMIAYSAIEDGAKPFGDTGIRALFDDADELGAFKHNSTDMVWPFDLGLASDITVEYAGLLAKAGIVSEEPLSGVILYDAEAGSLSIDGSAGKWTVGDAPPPPIVGWDQLLAETLANATGLTSAPSDAGPIANLVIADGNSGSILHAVEGLESEGALLIGGWGSDQIAGSPGSDILVGLGKNDVLDAGWGKDFIYGGPDDDLLIGGPGADTLDGGSGFDTADYYDSPQRVVLLLANTDEWGVGGEPGTTNQAARLSGGDAEGDALVNIEKVATSQFDDLVFGFDTGTWADLWNGDDTFDNNEERDAEDHIFGGHGNDRIWTGAGDDELFGEWDDDWLIGEAGADKIVGGDGRDGVMYEGSPEGVTVILSPTDAWGVGGFDETKGLSPGGYHGTPSGSSGGHAAGDTFLAEDIENVVGSWFDDYIFGSSSGTVAELKKGNDWFDNAEAVAASDRVDGGEGDDHIWTGAGNDILNGGPENDDLWGEGGGDIFVFRDDFDFDTVHDFTLGLDQLWIVGFDRSHLTLLPGTGSDTVIRVVSTETYKDNEQITLKNFVAPQGFLEQITLADEPPDQPLI